MKALFCSALFTLLLCSNLFGQQTKIRFSTEEEIKNDLALVTCKNKERLDAVRKYFVKIGANENDIKIEKIKNVENLVITKKGKTDEKIVVGAHFDKTADGCGAIDNWTGIVILANIYRTMKDFSTEKTLVFAAFGEEEEGLRGSGEMAGAILKEDRKNYCAMVNFDSFGFSVPQTLANVSSKSLIDFGEEISKKMELPFGKAAIDLASSDSASFKAKDIPAVTFHGLSGNWKEYLHGSKDKLENINTQSVYLGYRHGLAMIAGIDAKPCEFFRESKNKK